MYMLYIPHNEWPQLLGLIKAPLNEKKYIVIYIYHCAFIPCLVFFLNLNDKDLTYT